VGPAPPSSAPRRAAAHRRLPAHPHPRPPPLRRRGTALESLLHGGGQERGARAGTESVLLIAGLGAAADVVRAELDQIAAHTRALRDELQATLTGAFGAGARVNGPRDPAGRLPNTLSISVKGLPASALLASLGDCLAASAAAACHSGAAGGSPVLAAMGVPPEWAAGTLRLSFGRHSTAAEARAATQLIVEAAAAAGVPVARRA
jgi:cysteine desulfurase